MVDDEDAYDERTMHRPEDALAPATKSAATHTGDALSLSAESGSQRGTQPTVQRARKSSSSNSSGYSDDDDHAIDAASAGANTNKVEDAAASQREATSRPASQVEVEHAAVRAPEQSGVEEPSAKQEDPEQSHHATDTVFNAASVQKPQQEAEAKLASFRQAREAAEGQVVELRKQHEAAEQHLRDYYEGRIADLHRELQVARSRLQAAEAQGTKGRVAASGDEVVLRGEDLELLRKEVREADMLINGYQQENLLAMKRIKELEEELGRTQAAAQEQVRQVERQLLLAQDDRQQRTADAAARLKRTLALEKEVEGVRAEAAEREAELRAAVERLRAEKRQLEAQLGGVDLQQIQEGDELVAKVKEEMAALKAAHAAQMTEVETKLAWYAENQELLTRNDQLVKEQAEALQQLRERLAYYEAGAGKAKMQKVREMERQMSDLKEALKGRNPKGALAAVLEATGSSSDQAGSVAQLETRVASLQDALKMKDDEYERRLRALQQDYERVKVELGQQASRAEGALRTRGRVRELEGQIEELRGTYTRKIKQLEQQLRDAESDAKRKQPAAARTSSSDGGLRAKQLAAQLKEKEEELQRSRTQLEVAHRQVSSLQNQLYKAEEQLKVSGTGLSSHTHRTPRSSEAGGAVSEAQVDTRHSADQPKAVAGNLQQRRQQRKERTKDRNGVDGGGLGTSDAEVEALQQLCRQLQEECASLTMQLQHKRSPDQALQDEVSALRQRLVGADSELHALRVELAAAAEHAALQVVTFQKQLTQVQHDAVHNEQLRWQQQMSSLEVALRDAEARADALQTQLAAVQVRGQGWTPAAQQFTELEGKIAVMEREQAVQTAQWRALLGEARRFSELQLEMQRKKWELELEAKSTALDRLRGELDGLLLTARLLQQQQQQSR